MSRAEQTIDLPISEREGNSCYGGLGRKAVHLRLRRAGC
jgi:hypothetical protein